MNNSWSGASGGIPAGASPNNTSGAGLLDARAAVETAIATAPNHAPGVAITAPGEWQTFACPATVSFGGTALDAEDGNLAGVLTWADNSVVFGAGSSPFRSYTCTQQPRGGGRSDEHDIDLEGQLRQRERIPRGAQA